MQFNGLNVVVSHALTRYRFDYSGFRSPSRAKRRHKSGKLRAVPKVETPEMYRLGNTLHVNPAALQKLKTLKVQA
jgi:hypothetical protein